MRRSLLVKKHFLSLKKILRKFIPFFGQIETVLAIISIIIGKDVDVFEEIYAQIPVVGGILTDGGSTEQGSYVNENGEIITTDGGIRRRNYNNNSGASESGSMIKKLFMIGGPIVVVMFLLGSGYAEFGVGQIGYQAAGLDLPNIGATVAQGVKTVQCVGDVACVRQWQFNNTQRPGSQEVGQEYKLEIENFNVNDGFPLDIANRRSDDRVPIDFSVYNPRHGLKGIDAKNVAYRVGVYDNAGSLLNDPSCQTGWLPLGGEYADNDFGQNGTILPGGFATPLGSHGELNLRECGLLQSALGINRRVRLQMAYDYSSQSTLQVQAMSRQNMLSLEERPRFKDSQTADTPVKTYVSVESPITYRDNTETGSAESSVFGLRVGFDTGQRDIKYRVHPEGFRLYDSSETLDVDSSDGFESEAITCDGLTQQEGDRYSFSSDMNDYLNNRQSNSWFESDSGPSPARCSMVLENPGSISPTGETLTFRIDANYTVMLEEIVGGFKVQNSQCSRFECPMLVPQSHEQAQSGNLISECESRIRLDANNGCGARMGENWVDVELDYALEGDVDAKIEEGETAVKWTNLLNVVNNQRSGGQESFNYKSDSIGSNTVIGVDLDSFAGTDAGVLGIRKEVGELEFENVDYQICESEDNLQSRYPQQSVNGDELVFASVYKVDCQNILEDYLDSRGCEETWGEALVNVATLDVADWFENTSDSCRRALSEYRECENGITGYRPESSRLACIGSSN